MIPSYAGGTPPGLAGGGGVAGNEITGTIEPEGRVLGKRGANVASGSDIILGQGNYFQITGSASILSISGASWAGGSIVVLHFLAAATLVHGSGAGSFDPITLAAGVDFVAASGDTIMLLYDESTWREV